MRNDKKTSTQFFRKQNVESTNRVKEVLANVYNALNEKGYNPVYQIVGYILSDDPTYITSHSNARTQIGQLERDEILDELVKNYIENNLK